MSAVRRVSFVCGVASCGLSSTGIVHMHTHAHTTRIQTVLPEMNFRSAFQQLIFFSMISMYACWCAASVYRQTASRSPPPVGPRWHVVAGFVLSMFVPILAPLLMLLVPGATAGMFSGVYDVCMCVVSVCGMYCVVNVLLYHAAYSHVTRSHHCFRCTRECIFHVHVCAWCVLPVGVSCLVDGRSVGYQHKRHIHFRVRCVVDLYI